MTRTSQGSLSFQQKNLILTKGKYFFFELLNLNDF